MSEQHILGSLLGTAAGDALGLPHEGLSRRRAARLFGPPDRYRLLPGRGMVSDDSEHACMTALALLRAGKDEAAFGRALAWRLRGWLAALPPGIGLATLRACGKLCLGFGYRRSGVFSAGNGPAMRAAIIGAVVDEPPLLVRLVSISTRTTHTDPKAEWGARAVALAAWLARQPEAVSGVRFLQLLSETSPDCSAEFLELMKQAVDSAAKGDSPTEFTDQLGLHAGISGYMLHTLPVVIQAWLRHPNDLATALPAVIACGGDTDTTAAILGGIVGCRVGAAGVPAGWISGLHDWPINPAFLERLANRLAQWPAARPPFYPPFPLLWLRNLPFMALVLLHGLRRLLPPW